MDLGEKWYAVVNPHSANGKTQHQWPELHEKVLQAGIEMEYAFTAHPGEGTHVTREALRQGYQKIIAVGGDGTVNEVLNGLITDDRLVSDSIRLAVLGRGTGSDFIRSLKNNHSTERFIQTLKENTYQIVDIGKVEFLNKDGQEDCRYFLNASNIGIGAEVVNRVNNRSKALGSKLTYFTGTMATVFNYGNIKATIKFEDNKLEGFFCGLMICNGQYIGGGMQVAPQASLSDGLFDLIVIKDITKTKLLTRFPLIYQGKHIGLPEIGVYQCKELFLHTPKTAVLEADGEIIGYSPGKYSMLPQRLKVLR
jgi:YegS/Rv2252/BmrU family lipid kinase